MMIKFCYTKIPTICNFNRQNSMPIIMVKVPFWKEKSRKNVKDFEGTVTDAVTDERGHCVGPLHLNCSLSNFSVAVFKKKIQAVRVPLKFFFIPNFRYSIQVWRKFVRLRRQYLNIHKSQQGRWIAHKFV